MSTSLSTSLLLLPPLSPSCRPAAPAALMLRSHCSSRSRRFSLRCSATSDLAALAPAASAVYGALLLGGGLFAYARTKSTGSLSGGVSGAALMAVAYYLMQNPETRVAGEALAFGSAALFASVFGIRLASTRKFMPSGLLLSISGASMWIFISAYLQDKI